LSKELLPSSREPNVKLFRVPAKFFFIFLSAAESTVSPPHWTIKELFPSSREPNVSLFLTSAKSFSTFIYSFRHFSSKPFIYRGFRDFQQISETITITRLIQVNQYPQPPISSDRKELTAAVQASKKTAQSSFHQCCAIEKN